MSRSRPRARGTAIARSGRSIPISSAWEVIRSTGSSARRASHQPPSAVARRAAGPARSSRTSTRWTDSSPGRAIRATTSTRRSRGGRPARPSPGNVLRPCRARRSPYVRCRPPPPPGVRGRHRLHRDRIAEADEHASVLSAPVPRARLGESTVLLTSRKSLLPSSVALRDLCGARPYFAVDGRLQVRPELEHDKRAEPEDDGREQQRVPRGEADADREPHSASSMKPTPRTVLISLGPSGCSSFLRR